MAIRSFGKADRGVQVSRWDPLPQSSPGEQSADNRQGDGSIPSAATNLYSGKVELAHHDGLISRSSKVRFLVPLPFCTWGMGLLAVVASLAMRTFSGVGIPDPPPVCLDS